MMAIVISTKYLISESQTEGNIYTDDPQPPGGALVKENHSLWDNEW